MAWIELHQAVRDHRKIVALADVLNMPEPHVIGHLACLWLWSLDNAPDGKLPASNRVIARAAQWDEGSDAFVAALITCGLLDDHEDFRSIHDWDEYAGKLIERREANKTRMRNARAANVQSTSHEPFTDVQSDSTVQYRTQQNSTEPTKASTVVLERAKPKPQNRNHQIPDDWTPSPGVLRVAQELHMDLPAMQTELDKFASHFRANGKVMADWNQAAMNWLRRSLDFARPPNGRKPNGPDFVSLARQLRAQEAMEQ